MDKYKLGKNGEYGVIDFPKLQDRLFNEGIEITNKNILSSIFNLLNTNNEGDSKNKLDNDELSQLVNIIKNIAGDDNIITADEVQKFDLFVNNQNQNIKEDFFNFLGEISETLENTSESKASPLDGALKSLTNLYNKTIRPINVAWKNLKSEASEQAQVRRDQIALEYLCVLEQELQNVKLVYQSESAQFGWTGDVANFVKDIFGSDNTEENVEAALKQYEKIVSDLKLAYIGEYTDSSGKSLTFEELFEQKFGKKFDYENCKKLKAAESKYNTAYVLVLMETMAKFYTQDETLRDPAKEYNILKAEIMGCGRKDMLAQAEGLARAGNYKDAIIILQKEKARLEENGTVNFIKEDSIKMAFFSLFSYFNKLCNFYGYKITESSEELLVEIEKLKTEGNYKKALVLIQQCFVNEAEYLATIKESILPDGTTLDDLKKAKEDVFNKVYGSTNNLMRTVRDYISSQETGTAFVKGGVVTLATITTVATAGTTSTFSAAAVGAVTTAGTSALVEVTDRKTNGIDDNLELSTDNLHEILKNAAIDGGMFAVTAGLMKFVPGVPKGEAVKVAKAYTKAFAAEAGIDASVGIVGDYAKNGEITSEGVAYNLMISVTANLGLKGVGAGYNKTKNIISNNKLTKDAATISNPRISADGVIKDVKTTTTVRAVAAIRAAHADVIGLEGKPFLLNGSIDDIINLYKKNCPDITKDEIDNIKKCLTYLRSDEVEFDYIKMIIGVVDDFDLGVLAKTSEKLNKNIKTINEIDYKKYLSKGKNIVDMTDAELKLYYEQVIPFLKEQELDYLIEQAHRLQKGEPKFLGTQEEYNLLKGLRAKEEISNLLNGVIRSEFDYNVHPKANIPLVTKELTDVQNRQLSSWRWSSSPHRAHLDPVFDDVAMTLQDDVFLYRGLRVVHGYNDHLQYFNNIKPGAIIDNSNRYISTAQDISSAYSYSKQVDGAFGQQYVLKIKVPQGSKCIDHRISDSGFDEITLPPNKLKVISVDYCTGIVECEYISLND